jgi:hypothetical protein
MASTDGKPGIVVIETTSPSWSSRIPFPAKTNAM